LLAVEHRSCHDRSLRAWRLYEPTPKAVPAAFSERGAPLDLSERAMESIQNGSIDSGKEIVLAPEAASAPSERPSRARMAIAFAVAAVSDFCAIGAKVAPPFEWALDIGTAFALFLILGRRWALLPGLIAEAIPGLAVFPWWVLVVLSITLYDGIKRPNRS
jgi:hypothetical protein